MNFNNVNLLSDRRQKYRILMHMDALERRKHIFRDELEQDLPELQAHIDKSELSDIAHFAHKYKLRLNYFGYNQALNQCVAIQEKWEEDHDNDILPLATNLNQILSTILNSLTMRVLIIEDDFIAFDIADSMLRNRGYSNIEHSVGIKDSVELLRKNTYDLIFLDVHLEDGEGTDLLEIIPHGTKIIFTTYDPAYAVEAFEVQAVDYLVKPISDERFDSAMKRIEGEHGEHTVVIKADLIYHKILIESIFYVKSNKDYLTLHAEEGTYTFYGRIKNFINQLPVDDFMQCHRSYIINLNKVSSFTKDAVVINGESIPVSEPHRKEVGNRFLKKT